MEPGRNNGITKREKRKAVFFLISSFVMIFAIIQRQKQHGCQTFFCASNYLYAILHRFLQIRRATPLTKKKRILYQTQCQRCYFPLVFLYLFLFLLESKYKYTTTADGETITFEVLDTISEVPAQFVSSVFQNICYYCLLLINNF